ncbi:hypothetical protein GWN26_06910 [Candidatus Saccharibacteria bacterium]|nr:hypothetical protein [Candidatus Saccharibacteria bacterium]NIW79152.1 hypothetical protein [Calditrichia bacterium]
MNRSILTLCLLIAVLMMFACGKEEPVSPEATQGEQPAVLAKEGDPAVLAMMDQINAQLAASGSNLFLNEIQFFTIGQGRPSNRILQQPFRWVPNDARRAAQGIDITYIADQSFQGTSSGVSAAATEAEIDAAMTTWDTEQALKKVSIVKRSDPNVDISIFDEFFPTNLPFGDTNPDEPAPGNPFLGDIVNVGWYPRGYFEAVGGPGGGDGILAFSVTFIFGSFDSQGNFIPSDINGDNYLDTALNEVYYNDRWGNPADPPPFPSTPQRFPWATGQLALPNIDVQTVGLHENGHSLEIGHFGPPPAAVMNPVYAGPRISPFPSDEAAMEAVWASWPNP